MRGGEFLGFKFAFGACGTDEDDFRAQSFCRSELVRRRIVGHHNDSLCAECTRGKRHTLGMVAGGIGDDAADEGVGRELRDAVVRATQLEAADRLGGLILQVDVGVVSESSASLPCGGARA